MGHRGWPSRYPENSLTGFIAATEVADMVEMDVRRSADGKLILSHDPMLIGLRVSDTAWSELAELDIGNGHHPALLDEVLAAIPGFGAQLEVKNTPGEPGFEPDHRLALETASRAREGDIVTSFNPATLQAVRRHFDEVRTGLAVEFTPSMEEVIDHCRAAGHSAIVPAAGLVHISWVERAIGHGIEVYPWTVNDLDVAAELVGEGVSGIITDDPAAIASIVRGEQ